MKRTGTLVLYLLLALAMLTGCGPEMDAAQSTLILCNLYVKADTSQAAELKLSEEDMNQVVSTIDNTLTGSIKDNFSSNGLAISDDKVAEILAARKEAMNKLTITTEVLAEEKKTSQVRVTTNYIDELQLDEKAATDALAAVGEMELTDQEEMLQKATEMYVENLIAGYKNATPSEETKEIVANCTVTDNVWLPEDITGFSTQLSNAVIGG